MILILPIMASLGVLSVGLLFAGALTGSRRILIWGNVALAICFGFTACASLYLGSVFLSLGFGVAAVGQAYRLCRAIAG